jgi:hypothetical protein
LVVPEAKVRSIKTAARTPSIYARHIMERFLRERSKTSRRNNTSKETAQRSSDGLD